MKSLTKEEILREIERDIEAVIFNAKTDIDYENDLGYKKFMANEEYERPDSYYTRINEYEHMMRAKDLIAELRKMI